MWRGSPRRWPRKRDGLFVKNLENVQGDERDVILFSTGFSANADGVLPLNFGPLNRSGGERRLNVAVTRARRRVMVFSSFEPEDLRVEQTSSVGIRDLRRYLEVAKYGVATTPAAVSAGQVGVDRHRDDIAAALRSAGLDVATAVGLSEFQIDLTVAPRGEPMALAVLLDSPAWAERRTTSDRDALPVVVLERIMGWPKVVRVWLPDWLEDRDSVVARLVVAAGEAASAPRSVGERVVTTSAGMRVAAEGPQDAVALWTLSGTLWALQTLWTLWTRRCSPPTSPHVMTFRRTFRTSARTTHHVRSCRRPTRSGW